MLAAISKRNFVARNGSRALALRGACLVAALGATECVRTTPTDQSPPSVSPSRAAGPPSAGADVEAGSLFASPAVAADPPPPSSSPAPTSPAPSSSAPPAPAVAEAADGPHSLPLEPGRAVFYALPRESPAAHAGAPPWRLVGHLHGICYPPSYSAGRWLGAAVDVGVLVAPTGNAHCGDGERGPPSWEAPSWEELVAIMDGDLERSVAKVAAKHPGTIRRDGAVLTGFSRGAYAAPVIARMHPGRWPYLVLIEANVPLSVASLRKAGVRAVAFLAGEMGTELAGERKTDAALTAAGFPSRLFVMPKVGHFYPDDMDELMAEALAFVLTHAS